MLFASLPGPQQGLSSRLAIAVMAALVGLLPALSSCSDDSASTPGGDADVATDQPEGDADAVEDPGEDADAADETGDTLDEEAGGPCPGSISCFDPILDRPRAALCVQAGFETGTSCDLVEGGTDACCVPPFRCETNQDCEDAREDEGFCIDDRFACVCNEVDGSCSSFVCLTDSECDGEDVCRGGTCEPAGATEGLVALIVTPPGLLVADDTRQLVAVAVDPTDPERVFTNVAIAWETDASEVVAVSETGLASGGATAGSAVITARVADNEDDPGDTVALYHYLATDVDLRVIVVDENTHAPIAGALVYVESPATEPLSALTDDAGVFEHDVIEGPFDITVFSVDHTYVTHVGVSTGDIVVSCPPVAFGELSNPEGEGSPDRVCEDDLCYDLTGVGAVTGEPDFDLVANSGEVEVSLTGFSLGNGLLDLNFELIVGPNVERDLSDGPIPVDGLSEIPGGVTLAFNGEPLVGSYVLTASPGERVLWTLGGRVSLSDNPTLLPDIIEQIDGNLDIAQLISIVLPLFDNFYSGVVAGVEVELPDEDSLNLGREDVSLAIPVSRRVFVTAPTMPSTTAGELETGVFLAGASVPGLGFLPLGITAAADGAQGTPVDGVLDGDPDDADIDPVVLNFAPIHGGIQGPGTQYVLVSVALPLDAANSDAQGENSSGLIFRVPAGQALPAEIALDEFGDFPTFPEGSSYDHFTRELTVVPSDDFEAGFYRALFRGQDGRNWQVHLGGGALSYTLPDPTAIAEELEDRTGRDKLTVLSVGFGDLAVDYDQLLAASGPTLDNLVDFVAAFAVLEVEATDSGAE